MNVKDKKVELFNFINKNTNNNSINGEVIQIIKKHTDKISKNHKGYWVDINLLPEDCVNELHNVLFNLRG